ncbi:hypothetical protein [Streptomyces griseus]
MSRVDQTLSERDAALLVSSRQWPVLAHRMHRMAQQNVPFTAHLARIAPDTATWRTGPPSGIAARLLLAAHHTTRPGPAHRPPRFHHSRPLTLHHRGSRTRHRRSSPPPPHPASTTPLHPGRDADGSPADLD